MHIKLTISCHYGKNQNNYLNVAWFRCTTSVNCHPKYNLNPRTNSFNKNNYKEIYFLKASPAEIPEKKVLRKNKIVMKSDQRIRLHKRCLINRRWYTSQLYIGTFTMPYIYFRYDNKSSHTHLYFR